MLSQVLIQLGIGRVLLSWLPPGRLGGHAPDEVPATLAASYLLGGVILWLQSLLVPGFGVAGWGWSLAPWVVLLIARVATLPAYFVAGAEPRHEPRGPFFWGLVALMVAGGVVLQPQLPVVAFLPLASHLLWQGRRAPSARALLVCAALGLMGSLDPGGSRNVLSGIHLGLGAGFLIPWLRRNDLRAAWLSALFFLATAASGMWLASLLGWAVLLGSAHKPQRRYVGKVLATVAPLALLVAVREEAAGLRLPGGGAWAVLCVVTLASVAASARRWSRARSWKLGRIEAPVREGTALLALLVVGLAATLVHGVSGAEAVVALVPISVLWVGVTFLPSERPASNG